MTHLFNDFFPPEVLALVHDRSVDFTLPQSSTRLSQPQIDFLFDHLGGDIAHIVNVRQVHGSKVITAGRMTPQGVEADALVTHDTGIPIAVRTADCLSVFLFDTATRAIGLVHAGWKGSKDGVVSQTVEFMKEEFGCAAENLKAAFGPCIGPCCYQVGVEFREHFPGEIRERDGKLFLDLALVNKRQLTGCGIPGDHILTPKACTACDVGYFSYRREKDKAGRMISLMMLRSR